MRLSPRLLQVVELIGGRGLSYKAAAREMGGISAQTVEEYAAEIRARAGLPMRPRDAMARLYHQLTEPKPKRKPRKSRAA